MIDWNWLTVIAITLGALGFWLLWKVDNRLTRPGLQARMADFAAQAVALARDEFKLELDYGLESLAKLDEILEQFHQRHLRHPIEDRDLSKIVLIWGGYLGMTLQKAKGGVWESDSLLAGKNTYPLRLGESEAVPVMWCLRRIRKGQAARLTELVDGFLGKASIP